MVVKSRHISVIIPTCHRNDLLAKCLDCLAPGVQTLPIDLYEVIITDDGSKSTAEDIIREHYPWARWVAGPRKGPAANRNNGALHAIGEWLAFTDDDCLPTPEWLHAFAAVNNGSALALEGAIHSTGNIDQDLAECPVNIDGGKFWSANIAVHHNTFDRVYGFDANYTSAAHEDQDLQIRLSYITNIFFVADARVFHPVRVPKIKQIFLQMPRRCSAFAYHAKKHRQSLAYETTLKFALSQYGFHLRGLKSNMIKLRFKSTLASLAWLFVGVPLNVFHFRRY